MCQLIRKVLVAIDGSENSLKALDFAIEFADKYSAQLTIINVAESPVMGAVPMEPTTVSGDSMVLFAKDLRYFHEEILSKAVARVKALKPALVVFSKLGEGEPALEIVAEAKEGGFDVVVVGHRGLGRVKEMFLGNIAEKVVHLAPCIVIIIR